MSEAANYKAGDQVFLIDGTSAYYVAPLPASDGHIISLSLTSGWEDDEGFNDSEVMIRVPRVFAEPPVREVNMEVAEAQARLDGLAEQEAEARALLEKVEAHNQESS